MVQMLLDLLQKLSQFEESLLRAVKLLTGLILLSGVLPACRPKVLNLVSPTASPVPADIVLPEPSILDPMLAPSVTLSLPTLPEGFYWQGVEIIEFAIPVPEGWFVAYSDLREVFGWEYWFEYIVTREDPTKNEDITSMMVITVIKDNEILASKRAAEMFSAWEHNSIRVIDTQVLETENTVTYHLYVEGPNEFDYPDETRYTIFLADKSNNVFYVILSASPTTEWDEFWFYGQVMSQRLVDLLQD